MKLINRSKNALSHNFNNQILRLEIDEFKDVPKEVAQIWLKYEGVEVYISPEDLEKAKEKAVKEALEKEEIKEQEKQPAKAANKKPAKAANKKSK